MRTDRSDWTRSYLFYYFVPLVDVIRAGEEDAPTNHFSHDATDRPNIHVLFVAAREIIHS